MQRSEVFSVLKPVRKLELVRKGIRVATLVCSFVPRPCTVVVSCGHTLFRKRGKGSGNFRYSSLLPRTVECGTNHSAVFSYLSVVITTSIGNYKV